MTLERMRGPYRKLVRRLERAGYQFVAGGDEPDDYLYVNPKSGKELWLVRVKPEWFVISRRRPE